MPEAYRIYLDQMLRLEVARALTDEGCDVVRASEVGQERADDLQILHTASYGQTFDRPQFSRWCSKQVPYSRTIFSSINAHTLILLTGSLE